MDPPIGSIHSPSHLNPTQTHQEGVPERQPASNEPKLAEEMKQPGRRVVDFGSRKRAQDAAPPPAMPPVPALPSMREEITLARTAPPRPPKVPEGGLSLTGSVQPVETPALASRVAVPDQEKDIKKPKKFRLMQTLSSAIKEPKKEGVVKSTKSEVAENERKFGLVLIQKYGKDSTVIGDPLTYERCADTLRDQQHIEGSISTTMLRLYDIAAEIHEKGGNFEAAFSVRQKGAEALKFKKDHDLYQLSGSIAKVRGTTHEICGLHRSSGSPQVNGGLIFQTRPNAFGPLRDELKYEINSTNRMALETRLDAIAANPEAFNQSLPKGLGTMVVESWPTGRSGRNDNYTEKNHGFIQGRDPKTKEFSSELGNGQGYSAKEFRVVEFQRDGKPIGRVLVGSDPDRASNFHNVRAEVLNGQENGAGLHQMQQMLTVLGLGSVLGKPLVEDQEMRVIHLIAESYFPQIWSELQKDPGFFLMSRGDLEKKIIEMLPPDQKGDAIELFKDYTKHPERIGKVELLPGNERVTLNDLSQKMQKNGYVGCMVGVGSRNAAVNICKLGALSTELRESSGIIGAGASASSDKMNFASGGTFLRMETRKTLQEPLLEKPFKKPSTSGERLLNEEFIPEQESKRYYSGKYQFAVAPEVVNGGGYAFYGDWFGVKNPNEKSYPVYEGRDNLVDFSAKVGDARDRFSTKANQLNAQGEPINPDGTVQKDPLKGTLNEVIVPGGCVPPKFFRGINCIDEFAKLELIQEFDSNKMLGESITDSSGKVIDRELLLGGGSIKVSLNDFLHVGMELKEEMWKNHG